MRPSAKKYNIAYKKKVDVERDTYPPCAVSEIAHELKNCVSVLLLLVETIEIDRQHPVPDEDNMKDLKNLIFKMNGLVDKLK